MFLEANKRKLLLQYYTKFNYIIICHTQVAEVQNQI